MNGCVKLPFIFTLLRWVSTHVAKYIWITLLAAPARSRPLVTTQHPPLAQSASKPELSLPTFPPSRHENSFFKKYICTKFYIGIWRQGFEYLKTNPNTQEKYLNWGWPKLPLLFILFDSFQIIKIRIFGPYLISDWRVQYRYTIFEEYQQEADTFSKYCKYSTKHCC